MEIVKLTPADWKKFKNIRLEALKNESQSFGTTYEEGLKKTVEEWKEPLGKSTSYIFGAEENNELFGLAAAYQENGKKCSHVAYIWGVYVRKSHRRKGIGKKLMVAIIKELKSKKVVKANLNVTIGKISALKLYQSLGFKTVGIMHKEMKVNGKYLDEYLMEKIF
jgi:ribosomal protein S18 acetylase RimI-like enzyme